MPVTKEDAIAEANSMLDLTVQRARQEIEKVINSGGLKLSAYDNDIEVGKIVAKTALKEAIYQYLTLNKKADKEVENLLKLI